MTSENFRKLPFKIVSSSVTTGYQKYISDNFRNDIGIANLHSDYYGEFSEAYLQSPFTEKNVGGFQHRHIELNTSSLTGDFNRPEYFKLVFSASSLFVYGPDFENVNKPRAQYWRGAKSPINIKNIVSNNSSVGNYEKNYQIFQTTGRAAVNNLIADGYTASVDVVPTKFIYGANNFTLPNLLTSSKSIFVQKFNAPGSKEESSRGSLDRAGEEYSPNASLLVRNIKVRQPFYNQLTQHSPQFGSGSTYEVLPLTGTTNAVSIHKVNRNGFRKLVYGTNNSIVSSSKYDNFWIQHNIPRSNYGYSWITSSAVSNVYETENFTDIPFDLTASLIGNIDVDLANHTLLGSLSGSDQSYSPWRQVRVYEHPVSRKLRENNLIPVQDKRSTVIQTVSKQIRSIRPNKSVNFREPPVISKFYPFEQKLIFDDDVEGEQPTTLIYSDKNLSAYFSNESLNDALNLPLTSKLPSSELYEIILNTVKYSLDSPIREIASAKFKETIYPRGSNTYLSGTRGRIEFNTEIPGFEINGYDRQLGTQRIFWKDNQEDRKRSLLSEGGYNNSIGLNSTQESGSGFFITGSSILINETPVNYTSSVSINSEIDLGIFNSISALESSSSLKTLYTSFQSVNGGEYYSNKISKIGRISGELNEGFVDFYNILPDQSGLGALYKNSLYKSIFTHRPYEIGSTTDLNDTILLIPTEDDSVLINPKPRYVAFIGGTEISQDLIGFYNTASNLFTQEIAETNYVFSTMDNGLLRATEKDSGKTPFFDSYEDFIQDIRNSYKDYSILPEFNISDNLKYYISSSAGNFRRKNNSLFKIEPNSTIEFRSSVQQTSNFNVNFFKNYIETDPLNGNKKIENDYQDELEVDSVSLTCSGIKKLLPYNGFYPQDRTLQLAGLYSEYVDNNLQGGVYNLSYEDTNRNSLLFSHVGTTASLGRISSLSSLFYGDKYYVAASYNYFNNNQGLIKLFSSELGSLDNWQQNSIAEYSGSSTGSYFGQSIVLLSGTNGINLIASELSTENTGALYQITSSDGISWSNKVKINSNITSLPITGNQKQFFGSYVDGIGGDRMVVTVNEPGFTLSLNNTVYATYVTGSDVYVGGAFTNADSNPRSDYIAKYNISTNTWSNLGTGLNNVCYTITGSGSDVYVGGIFTTAGGTSANRIAKWNINSQTWTSIAAAFNGASDEVRTIFVSGTDLYIGGKFTNAIDSVSTKVVNNITKFDTSTNLFSPLLSGTNNTVLTIASSGSDIYAGGEFTSASNIEVNYMAKYEPSSNTWSGLSIYSIITSYIQFFNEKNILSGSLATGSDDGFGYSVAMNSTGDRVIVGAYKDEAVGAGENSGLAYIFVSGAGGWSQQHILSGSLATLTDQFGNAVAMNSAGDRVIIGASGDEAVGAGSSSGLAYIFVSGAGGWSQQHILSGSLATGSFDVFGTSVAMNSTGDRVIVSALYDEAIGAGENSGLVYIFVSGAGGWTQQHIFSGSLATGTLDNFGQSVAMNSAGDRVIVGAASDEAVGTIQSSGLAYIFVSGAGGWSQQHILSGSLATGSNDLFGYSVAMNSTGDRVIVGAVVDEAIGAGGNTGLAYIFVSGAGGWSQQHILSGSLATGSDDDFGISVAMNSTGDRVIVGAKRDEAIGAGGNTGLAYIFVSGAGGWTQQHIFSGSLATGTFDGFGQSVAMNSTGDRVIVGAASDEAVGASDSSGLAYIFVSGSTPVYTDYRPGLNNTVQSIILSEGLLYLGGDFTQNNATSSFKYVASYSSYQNRFNNLNTGLNNSVRTLKLSGSSIYAGGDFTITGSRISVWNGSSWSAISNDIIDNSIYSLNYSGSYLIVGGTFSSPTTRFAINNGTSWEKPSGKVYTVTSLNGQTWSDKQLFISGSGVGRYSSIVKNNYYSHPTYVLFGTDKSDNGKILSTLVETNPALINSLYLSSSFSNTNITVLTGSTSASLNERPIDSLFVQDKIYLFATEQNLTTLENQAYFVASSSFPNVFNFSNKIVLLTGSTAVPIITTDLQSINSSINISSFSSSNVINYAFGYSSLTSSVLYLGKSIDGLSWQANERLIQVQKGTYFAENIDSSQILFVANDNEDVYSILNGKFATYRLKINGNENYNKFSALEPFFAPGIIYNTIKSGIAVDWPCTTGSNLVITSSTSFGLISSFYPKTETLYSLQTENGIINAQGSIKSNINYRIPFENVIFPNEAFEPKDLLTSDIESYKTTIDPYLTEDDLVYKYLNKSYIYGGYETHINPLDTSNIDDLGSKRFSVPFTYRRNQSSDSGLYTLGMSNFFAETIKFFLKDEKLVTFTSLPDNKWKQFKAGTSYYMDIVLEKSNDLVMIESYASDKHPVTVNGDKMNGRYFGYPTNKTNKKLWTGDQFTQLEKKELHNDPAYAPYTPPYFEGIAKARIKFTPTITRNYTLEEVFELSTVENIFPGVERSAVTGSDALVNKMPIESSVEIKGSIQSVNVTIRTDQSNQEVSEDPSNKIWVISPKMETPVLDFSNQELVSYKNNYSKTSGYGRGMWSGYGTAPSSGKGIRIRLEYPFARENTPNTSSLLEQVGFKAEEKNIGSVAETKQISEAIIAIPYLERQITPSINNTLRTSRNRNSFFESRRYFIDINKQMFNVQRANIENAKSAILAGQLGSQNEIISTTVSDMIQKMKKYVIPPELNFLNYPDINPFIMYIFEFEHTLDKEDLVDIWQGLKPKISMNFDKDEIKIEHKMNKFEFFEGNSIPNDIKWLVFKVKKKGEYDYFSVTATTKDDKRFDFNKIIGRKQGTDVYSYNWPYDYFSLVELAKIDVEVNYKKKKEE